MAWLLTAEQSGKTSWRKGLSLQEGLVGSEYPHRWKKPKRPGIWTPEVELKPWVTRELQQVLEPDLAAHLSQHAIGAGG